MSNICSSSLQISQLPTPILTLSKARSGEEKGLGAHRFVKGDRKTPAWDLRAISLGAKKFRLSKGSDTLRLPGLSTRIQRHQQPSGGRGFSKFSFLLRSHVGQHCLSVCLQYD